MKQAQLAVSCRGLPYRQVVKQVKLYVNARFLSQSVTGVQRYARELVKALDDLLDDPTYRSKYAQIKLLAPQNVDGEFELKNMVIEKVGHLTGHLWEQLELPFYSRDGVLVNLCNTGPLLKRNQIVTIHDMAVFAKPNAFSFKFRTWYRFLLKWLARRTLRILTVSNFSKDQIVKYTGIPSGKITVTYLGKEHILALENDNRVLSDFNLTTDNYILAVSSMNPNKNFAAIQQAVDLLDKNNIDIVIAGASNSKVFGKMNDEVKENVKWVGYVNDNQLKTLYEHALCFVFPSLYEGFGLPPLEAMVLGCPVIVSSAASLPEVFGDAAMYCDPNDPQDLANKMQELIHNSQLRNELKSRGTKRANQYFSWKRCAQETMAVIEEVPFR